MNASKNKPADPIPPESDFFKLAVEAMKRAQRNAARENARYGLKLILERKKPKRRKSQAGLGKSASLKAA